MLKSKFGVVALPLLVIKALLIYQKDKLRILRTSILVGTLGYPRPITRRIPGHPTRLVVRKNTYACVILRPQSECAPMISTNGAVLNPVHP